MNPNDLSGGPISETRITAPAAWSPVAVRLLQGVLYLDDGAELWETLLSNQTPLSDYFGKLSLSLIVDETDGMAYLRQWDEDELPADYPAIPKLFRRTPLSYEATLLCVLLRDQLRQFEEHDVQNERCIVTQSDLLSVLQSFFPDDGNEGKGIRARAANLRKLEELKFVKQFEKEPPSWEVRRIMKARLPLSQLETIRQALLDEVAKRAKRSTVATSAQSTVQRGTFHDDASGIPSSDSTASELDQS